MPTKTTSRKTTASARATPKKLNGDSPKPAKTAKTEKTATVAQGEKARAPQVRKTARAEQGEAPARVAKPAEATKKVAARRRKNAGAPEAQAEAVAMRLEVDPRTPARPSREEIAARAAALWRQNGGAAFDNWIRAERELGA